MGLAGRGSGRCWGRDARRRRCWAERDRRTGQHCKPCGARATAPERNSETPASPGSIALVAVMSVAGGGVKGCCRPGEQQNGHHTQGFCAAFCKKRAESLGRRSQRKTGWIGGTAGDGKNELVKGALLGDRPRLTERRQDQLRI